MVEGVLVFFSRILWKERILTPQSSLLKGGGMQLCGRTLLLHLIWPWVPFLAQPPQNKKVGNKEMWGEGGCHTQDPHSEGKEGLKHGLFQSMG
jgi:hypothetical protein